MTPVQKMELLARCWPVAGDHGRAQRMADEFVKWAGDDPIRCEAVRVILEYRIGGTRITRMLEIAAEFATYAENTTRKTPGKSPGAKTKENISRQEAAA